MKVHLSEVRIASPCNADWNAMEGDDVSRFCGLCEKRVYNLTNMSQVEAERFLSDTEGKACIRLYRRPDGTVLTQDCPVGRLGVRKRLVGIVAGGVGALFVGLTSIASAFGKGKMVEDMKTEGRKIEPIRKVIDLVDPPPPPNSLVALGSPCVITWSPVKPKGAKKP